MDMFSVFFAPGVVFLLVLVFGFWLGEKGKPYHGLLFNLHKLVGLAAAVVAGVKIYNALQAAKASPPLSASWVAGALCVAALFLSGAFLSAEKFDYKRVKSVHNAAAVLLVVAAAAFLYLLGG